MENIKEIANNQHFSFTTNKQYCSQWHILCRSVVALTHNNKKCIDIWIMDYSVSRETLKIGELESKRGGVSVDARL